jgi:hypothetical protein
MFDFGKGADLEAIRNLCLILGRGADLEAIRNLCLILERGLTLKLHVIYV